MLRTVRIAIQGMAGSFHDIAARQLLGDGGELVACATFAEVVRHVEQGRADTAMLAIENSLVGSILPNYSLLQASRVQVVNELQLRVQQQLMACPGATLASIREVRSHPMALSQCETFLDKHPQWQRIEASDTAGSARDVAQGGRLDVAAIAPQLAAEVYGLTVLAPNIEDSAHNTTRFLQLMPGVAGDVGTHCSISFAVRDEPGSLHRALGVLAAAGWNLSKIQSVPMPGEPGRYRFFVDLIAPEARGGAGASLATFAAAVDELRVLGRYTPRIG